MKVLIAYTTKKGSTREVAQKVGEVLKSGGHQLTIVDLKDKPDPSGYDAVIVGAPIIIGRILHRAPKFVKKHSRILNQKPFACFVLGGTLAEDTPENREKMLAKLDKITDTVTPCEIGLFGGKYDENRDWRNWDKIIAWAEGLIKQFRG